MTPHEEIQLIDMQLNALRRTWATKKCVREQPSRDCAWVLEQAERLKKEKQTWEGIAKRIDRAKEIATGGGRIEDD